MNKLPFPYYHSQEATRVNTFRKWYTMHVQSILPWCQQPVGDMQHTLLAMGQLEGLERAVPDVSVKNAINSTDNVNGLFETRRP